MKIRRTVEIRMRDLESSGRGSFYEGAKVGQVLFSTPLEQGRLYFYIDGFGLSDNAFIDRVSFDEVLNVRSHLNVQLFSSASQSGCLVFYLPLDIECGARDLSLSLPFLSYSRVMNILVGLKDDWVNR
ncbi:hypothetical protein [Pseudomonas sp. ICMP 561]|uniref:hypothetical protein n=1 Tax=Pseudomonas sp. ICMP 561 TaxID=1718918 RepID=UPI0011452C67|nr:hypothetical protein [Pseudomonas sp. ICMP 561]